MAMRIQARRARIMKQEMKDSRSETRCPWHTSKTVCCRPALFDLMGSSGRESPSWPTRSTRWRPLLLLSHTIAQRAGGCCAERCPQTTPRKHTNPPPQPHSGHRWPGWRRSSRAGCGSANWSISSQLGGSPTRTPGRPCSVPGRTRSSPSYGRDPRSRSLSWRRASGKAQLFHGFLASLFLGLITTVAVV